MKWQVQGKHCTSVHNFTLYYAFPTRLYALLHFFQCTKHDKVSHFRARVNLVVACLIHCMRLVTAQRPSIRHLSYRHIILYNKMNGNWAFLLGISSQLCDCGNKSFYVSTLSFWQIIAKPIGYSAPFFLLESPVCNDGKLVLPWQNDPYKNLSR
jgi:hypothetical protein